MQINSAPVSMPAYLTQQRILAHNQPQICQESNGNDTACISERLLLAGVIAVWKRKIIHALAERNSKKWVLPIGISSERIWEMERETIGQES